MLVSLIGTDPTGAGDIAFLLMKALTAVVEIGPAIGTEMEAIGSSAIPGWALVSTDSESLYMQAILKFIQLVGLVGVLKGARGVTLYFSPDPNPKKPSNVFAPFCQIIFGMLAMVPQTVVDIAKDIVMRLGWG